MGMVGRTGGLVGGMNRVAISAAIGVAVAGGAFAAPYFGAHIPLPMMMSAAAALSMGAAVAVITRSTLDKPAHQTLHADLGAVRLKKLPGLIEKFPTEKGTLQLSIRPDTRIDNLEVFKNPGQYTGKDIVVSLRASTSSTFNPVELKKLFKALKDQLGFVHLLLLDNHDEFVGYLPGFFAKREFTGPGAEAAIAKYVVGVFADPADSDGLRQVYGAAKVDTISDEAKISDAIERMAGGFRILVVLAGGNHRRPIGLVNFNSLMGHTLGAQMAGHHGASAHGGGHTLGAFRPAK